MTRSSDDEPRALAVLFRERDRSPASGLRFGTVDVLRADNSTTPRGYWPQIGAEAIAREYGVPLIVEPPRARPASSHVSTPT